MKLPRIDIGGSNALALALSLGGVSASAWVWTFFELQGNLNAMAVAFLAFTLGLRHGFDADHITTIDNATRRLMEEGQSTAAVGLFFALGHSTVVVGICLFLGLSVVSPSVELDLVRGMGGVFGAAVSGFFLLFLGVGNLLVWRRIRRRSDRSDLEGSRRDAVTKQPRYGLAARLISPLFKVVSRSWHLFPMGLLFGLGLDTAVSIGAICASIVQGGAASLSHVLVYPILFTTGIVMVDTMDSIVMSAAYEWSARDEGRRARCNEWITLSSVIAAFSIGLFQVAGVVRDLLGKSGTVVAAIDAIREHFDVLGFLIFALFAIWFFLHMASRGGGRHLKVE